MSPDPHGQRSARPSFSISSFRASDHAVAALDVGFGREPEPAFTHRLESRVRRQGGCDVPYGLLGWGGAVGRASTPGWRAQPDVRKDIRRLERRQEPKRKGEPAAGAIRMRCSAS